mmetsp:Transcript_88435/g.249204  ORF Transcript_88435/g.249204 Transcript_88435/m.249204 type:complete len:389 (+) Transcript_88435:95-1261(+)
MTMKIAPTRTYRAGRLNHPNSHGAKYSTHAAARSGDMRAAEVEGLIRLQVEFFLRGVLLLAKPVVLVDEGEILGLVEGSAEKVARQVGLEEADAVLLGEADVPAAEWHARQHLVVGIGDHLFDLLPVWDDSACNDHGTSFAVAVGMVDLVTRRPPRATAPGLRPQHVPLRVPRPTFDVAAGDVHVEEHRTVIRSGASTARAEDARDGLGVALASTPEGSRHHTERGERRVRWKQLGNEVVVADDFLHDPIAALRSVLVKVDAHAPFLVLVLHDDASRLQDRRHRHAELQPALDEVPLVLHLVVVVVCTLLGSYNTVPGCDPRVDAPEAEPVLRLEQLLTEGSRPSRREWHRLVFRQLPSMVERCEEAKDRIYGNEVERRDDSVPCEKG